MADNIPILEKADLVKPVQKFLKSDSADVLTWELQPLTGSFGNMSGVFRVSGQAIDKNNIIDWRMVLKIVQSPANKGMPWLGDDPAHWNFWRREVYVFETDFLANVPPIFVVPACYGVIEKPGKIAWLWIEFFDNQCDKDWSLERYCTIAYKIGQFNGAYLTSYPLPTNTWLSRDFMRSFIGDAKNVNPYWANAEQQMLFWEHPVIQKAMGAPKANVLYQFVQEYTRFFDMLDHLPQTLCHRDCWVPNMMCLVDSEQIALIDWALVGIGPVGEELLQLVWSMIEPQSALPVEAVEKQLFEQYLKGLRDSGWQGNEKQVRFAYVASFVLRVGDMLLWFLNGAHLSNNPPMEPDFYLETLNDELVARHSHRMEIVLMLAKEAFDLIEQLEAK